jgi:hypothetical protein
MVEFYDNRLRLPRITATIITLRMPTGDMSNIALLHWRTPLLSAAKISFTVALTVWLAVFGPMLCQYHGLMWNHHHTATTPPDDFDTAVTTPLMDMTDMAGMSAEEHAKHHHDQLANQQPQPVQSVNSDQATVPLKDASTASIFNPVPSISTLLVSIMIVQSPDRALFAPRGDSPTRLYPESSLFPLQLAIPPLEQPPRL